MRQPFPTWASYALPTTRYSLHCVARGDEPLAATLASGRQGVGMKRLTVSELPEFSTFTAPGQVLRGLSKSLHADLRTTGPFRLDGRRFFTGDMVGAASITGPE